jgi:hypothetical protein
MYGDFSGRQREDESSVACIDPPEFQYVAKECAIRVGVFTGQDDMGSRDHAP